MLDAEAASEAAAKRAYAAGAIEKSPLVLIIKVLASFLTHPSMPTVLIIPSGWSRNFRHVYSLHACDAAKRGAGGLVG